MPNEALRLTRAPIIEAVVDINCDLPPVTDLRPLSERAKDALRAAYPKARRTITERVDFVAHAGKPAPTAVRQDVSRQDVSRLQFLTDDEKELVQFRKEGYSFNRLAPYATLDDYLPKIEWSWNVFRELVHPVQIRTISLRFINRIRLPLSEGTVDLTEYLHLMPQLRDETFEFIGFLNQQSAVEVATGNRVNIALVAEPMENDHLPVILDIEASDLRLRLPEDWGGILEAILSLRRLKNRVFERTLTPKCLNLYRQP